MLKLNINNVGASETRRQPTTSTQPVATRACSFPQFSSAESSPQSARGLAHSKSSAEASRSRTTRQRLGLRQPSAAFLAARFVGPASARAVAALLLLSTIASAADTAPVSAADAASPLQPLLDGLLGKYGWLTTVILVVGSLRLLFKPVMLAIENYVKQTPSATDDDRLAKFEAGPIYKIIA